MSLFSRAKDKKLPARLPARARRAGGPQFVDVHAHVAFPEYDHDRGAVCDRMRLADVRAFTVGVDLESSKRAVQMANQYAELSAIVGLHPTDTKDESFDREAYLDLADNIDVVGVGECGLDYYRIEPYDTGEKERQKTEFIKQVEFALEADLPLMLHCRPQKGTMDAYEDVLAVLKPYAKEHGKKLRGNVHFFVGDKTIADAYLELGFTLSFTGVITFAHDYDDVIRGIPLNMILAETDSPFVAPEPYRGKRNEPVNVRAVVKRIAELKDRPLEVVGAQIVQNTYRAFPVSE